MTERMTAAALRAIKPPRAKRVDREAPIQREIIAWLKANVPGSPLVFHVPNQIDIAGKAAARQIAKAKHNGMMPGAPDVVMLCYQGACLFEVKAEGNCLPPAQKQFRDEATRLGVRIATVRSVADVGEALASWGVQIGGAWRGDHAELLASIIRETPAIQGDDT